MKGKGLLLIASLIMYLGMTYDAKAQEAEMVETGTVVVSATLSEQLVEDVPSTMEVITQKEIQEYGATSVMEVIENLQGFQTEGLNGNMSLRGMPQDWTIVLVDGRRAPIQETQRESNYRQMTSINIANIERIEIIRGSAGAMYGSSSAGGVINIITKKSKERSGMVGVTYEESKFTNYWNLDSGQIGDWNFMINAQYNQFLPTRHSYEKYNSSHYPGNWYEDKEGNEWYLNANVNYKINDNNELNFIVDYNQYKTSTRNNRWSNNTSAYNLSTSHRKGDDYSLVMEYHGSTENHMFDVSASYANMGVYTLNSSGSETSSDDYYRYGIKASDYWTINDIFALTFGGEFYVDGADNNGAYTVDTKSVFAAYVVGEISLFDESLFIVPSARFDYDEVSGSSLTPQLGVTWEFIQDHRFKTNVGLGYRAPNMTELYGVNGWGGGETRGNSSLEPETSFNVELRYEGSWKDLSFAVGYFYNEIDNMISEKLYEVSPGVYEIVDGGGYTTDWDNNRVLYDAYNVKGKSVYQGFEAEISYDFLKYFTASLNYTYIDAKGPDGKVADTRTIPQMYKGQLNFYHPEWDFSTTVWANYYVDKLASDNTEFDFATASMSLSKGWNEGKFRTFITLDNFLTTKEDRYTYSYIGDFNARVGVEYKF